MTAGKVDDAETTHPEPAGPGTIDALVIRTAMHDGVAHARDIARMNLSTGCNYSRDSAHWRSPRLIVYGLSPSTGRRPCTAIGCSLTFKSSNPLLSNQRKTSS